MRKKQPAAKMPFTRSTNPITILKVAIRAMREEPRRYYQGWWILERKADGSYGGNVSSVRVPNALCVAEAKGPSCGTVGCVAGLVVAVTTPKSRLPRSSVIAARARRLLRLTYPQTVSLFESSAVSGTYGSPSYVEQAVRHIERFMRAEMGYKGPKL